MWFMNLTTLVPENNAGGKCDTLVEWLKKGGLGVFYLWHRIKKKVYLELMARFQNSQIHWVTSMKIYLRIKSEMLLCKEYIVLFLLKSI